MIDERAHDTQTPATLGIAFEPPAATIADFDHEPATGDVRNETHHAVDAAIRMFDRVARGFARGKHYIVDPPAIESRLLEKGAQRTPQRR